MWRSHAKRLGLVLTAALALRILCFAGLSLGDDPGYASLVNKILRSGFSAVGDDPLATRPLFLGPMALSVRLFGWSELALVLPTLVASLLGISATYVLGTCLWSPAVGAISAITLALFPLDVVHSTTLTNDIVGSAILGWGAAAGCWGLKASSCQRLAGWLAGALLACALAVKLSFAVPAVGVLGLLIWAGNRNAPRGDLSRSLLLGYAIGLGALALFFLAVDGRPLAPVSAELSFNRRYMLDQLLRDREQVLLAYPRWALLIQPADPMLNRLAPYGLFFPLALVALARLRPPFTPHAILAPAWILIVLLWLEFGPLQITPYAPIHRLPRFLHAAAIPGAVAIAAMVVKDWNQRGVRRVLAASLSVAYLIAGVSASNTMRLRHQDTMSDMRTAAAIVATHDGPVLTDNELYNYLAIRRGYERMDALQQLRPPATLVPADAMIVVGGSRRSELEPQWVAAFLPAAVPENWEMVASLSTTAQSWRTVRGVVYRNRGPATAVQLVGR